MVPNPKVWDRVDDQDKHGYLNRIYGIFHSDDELAKAVKRMNGMPITMSDPYAGSSAEYIKKSKARVKKRK
jgi:hypothetical protein